MTTQEFKEKHETQARSLEDKIIGDIHRMYTLIDSKSSTLLAHVSIMTAVCTFLYSSIQKDIVKYFFIGEAFSFMLIGFALLFCIGLSMYAAPDNDREWKDHYASSCKTRAIIYLAALVFTIIVTFVTLATIAGVILFCNDCFRVGTYIMG